MNVSVLLFFFLQFQPAVDAIAAAVVGFVVVVAVVGFVVVGVVVR